MKQSNDDFRWTGARERAAVLIAEDDLSDETIAAELAIGRVTLWRWKAHPVFQARVAEHAAALEAAMLRLAIAKRRTRVGRLNRDWERLHALIEARADEMAAETAGGSTGLLVRQTKVVGIGAAAQTIEEYTFDRAVLAELRAIEQQAAKELRQWTEKTQISGDPDNPVTFTIKIASPRDHDG